jgi:4-diphosphocytidyl-2-C-methyl-D-erythritol kinase
MHSITIQTPAKVNLFLNILEPRQDGFHDISTVMQAIDLFDVLHITPVLDQAKPQFFFSCTNPELENNPQSNLVVKAWRLFFKSVDVPPLSLAVHLEKHIPMQAGLGGGSSDAAAMLRILNHLSYAGLSNDELRLLASHLGSDVPFFIEGGIALATGRGEVIQQLQVDPPFRLPMVIIKPRHLSISTAEAYDAYRKQGAYLPMEPEHLLMALSQIQLYREQGLESDFTQYLRNDFESVLMTRYPLLAGMAERMSRIDIKRPLLCGSGSAMAGFTEHSYHRKKAVQEFFPENEYEILWVHTHPGGLLQSGQATGF